jgi:hypothetical protein
MSRKSAAGGEREQRIGQPEKWRARETYLLFLTFFTLSMPTIKDYKFPFLSFSVFIFS